VAAAAGVPDALVKQLRDPGRLVIPVGSRLEQSLMIVTKRKGVIKSRVETNCRFVPLLGDEGWR
jgi:protein-L-isoaspartate(D-aspartate) O-methyltransferase